MGMPDFLEDAADFIKGWAAVVFSLVLGVTVLLVFTWVLKRLWRAL
jgi:hypothetical protein